MITRMSLPVDTWAMIIRGRSDRIFTCGWVAEDECHIAIIIVTGLVGFL
jgi:hypothetical protein